MFWSWDHKALQPHSATFVFGDKVEFVTWSCFSECNFFLLIRNQDFYAYFVFVDQAAYCLFVCLLTNFTKILSEAVCFWFVFASGILYAVFMSFEVAVTFIWAANSHTNPGGFSLRNIVKF